MIDLKYTKYFFFNTQYWQLSKLYALWWYSKPSNVVVYTLLYEYPDSLVFCFVAISLLWNKLFHLAGKNIHMPRISSFALVSRAYNDITAAEAAQLVYNPNPLIAVEKRVEPNRTTQWKSTTCVSEYLNPNQLLRSIY